MASALWGILPSKVAGAVAGCNHKKRGVVNGKVNGVNHKKRKVAGKVAGCDAKKGNAENCGKSVRVPPDRIPDYGWKVSYGRKMAKG